MAETATLMDALKRALRARRISYSKVGEVLDLSEASVKRLFSRGGFTLEREQYGRWYAFAVLPLPSLGEDVGVVLVRSDPI